MDQSPTDRPADLAPDPSLDEGGKAEATPVSNTVEKVEDDTIEPEAPHATWGGEALGGAAGAIVGGAIGLVLGGPLGAAIGVAVGGGAGAGAVHLADEPNTGPRGAEIGAGTGALIGGIMGAAGGPVGAAVGATLGAAVGGASGEMVQDATEEIIEEHRLMDEAEAEEAAEAADQNSNTRDVPIGDLPVGSGAPSAVVVAPAESTAPVAAVVPADSAAPAASVADSLAAATPGDLVDLTGPPLTDPTPYRGASEEARTAAPGDMEEGATRDLPVADPVPDRGPGGTDTEYRSGGAASQGGDINDN
jgi:hypothetical protein